MDIDTGADGATLVTLHEGDSGHVDLLSGFGETQAVNNTSDHEEEIGSKVGESSPLHYQPNLFPESQRFLASTPATVKKQADQAGLSITTPSLSRNPIAPDIESSGGIMALSQVFQATQAPSSPFVNELPSGPLSDRPSPNIPIQSRPVMGSASSPFKAPPSSFKAPPSSLRRGYTEPQLNYISMKESQAKRDKMLDERRTKSAENIFSGDQSDDDFDREPSFVERLNRQRKIDEETNAQLANLTAPVRTAHNKRGEQSLALNSPNSGDTRRRSIDIAGNIQDDETQGSTMALQTVATSEEETEQEDERCPTPTVSRQPPSTEEDKENYDALPVNSSLTPSSTHDRLSQALQLDNGTLLHSTTPPLHQHSSSQRIGGHTSEVVSSQQIVRDSQPSPDAQERGNGEGTNSVQPWAQRALKPATTAQGFPASEEENAAGLEKVVSSPVGGQAFLSSPPPSKDDKPQRMPHRRQVELKSPVARRAVSISSEGSPTPLPPRKSLNMISRISSQDGTADATAVIPSTGTKEKSSSMPSRVAETPMHKPERSFDDTVPETRIPETSPHRIANDTTTGEATDAVSATEEDDELPPIYQEHRDGMDSSRVLTQRSQLTERPHLNAKILSSPSGRQRKALTEIASDFSPFTPSKFLDVDINLLTAEDREFTSMVGFSPIPPRKKRRGNDGQNVYASDPIIPVTPRPMETHFTSHIAKNEVPAAEPPTANLQQTEVHQAEISQHDEPESSEPIVTIGALQRKRPDSWRRAETVWEVDASPENSARRLLNTRRSRLSTRSDMRMAQEKRLRKSLVAKAVVIHNRSPTSTATTAESSDPIQGGDTFHSRANSQSSMPEISVLAPNQVFACFNGFKRAYYPASCLGMSSHSGQTRYVVKFEDDTTDHVLAGTIKRLELHIGDSVKVDMPNVQKVTHIVRGFRDLLSPEELNQQEVNGSRPITDIYGYSSVMLAPKQRRSPRKGSSGTAGNLIKVPISRIYLDTILWNQLKDRQFSFTPGDDDMVAGTPADIDSAPATPNSRLSRSIIVQSGLFAGMVFAVSYVENENSKSHVMKLIVENGGRLLRDGFNELFELPSSIIPASPVKSPASNATDGSEKQFRLTAGAETVGFACLVADKHSRREKYMQALALGLPCLSGRWIEDSVKQNRILDWDMYLLPAGESMYLHGATKSRILTPTPAAAARFTDTIAARPKLLEGQSVLLVMGRGKAEEKKKAYIFLTYALGAARVERVLDLKAAKEILMEQGKESSPVWNWVYVDDHEEAAAKAMILGNSEGAPVKPHSGRGRKRKRPAPVQSVSDSSTGVNVNNIRIVGNEFVCQSLILGKLFDE